MGRILIITTGGTIEGQDYNSMENSSVGPTVSIEVFLQSANITCDYTIENAFQKDSRFITDEDRLHLAEKISSSNFDHILITHGTFTMAETAKFLGKLGIEKTIVLMGAFILGTEQNTDAPFNLGYALGSMKHLREGVYVAMHGRIFSWENVRKNLDRNQFEEEF